MVVGWHEGLHGLVVGDADDDLHRAAAWGMRHGRRLLSGIGRGMPIHEVGHPFPLERRG